MTYRVLNLGSRWSSTRELVRNRSVGVDEANGQLIGGEHEIRESVVESEIGNSQPTTDQIVQFCVVHVVDSAPATTGNDVVNFIGIRGILDVLEVVVMRTEKELNSVSFHDWQYLQNNFNAVNLQQSTDGRAMEQFVLVLMSGISVWRSKKS